MVHDAVDRLMQATGVAKELAYIHVTPKVCTCALQHCGRSVSALCNAGQAYLRESLCEGGWEACSKHGACGVLHACAPADSYAKTWMAHQLARGDAVLLQLLIGLALPSLPA